MARICLALVVVFLCACGGSAPRQPPPAPAKPPLTKLERAERKAQGIAAYERGDWATCSTLLEEADDPYDAACCHARAGNADRALAMLARAFDQGFRELDHIQKDPDLASLHADARWAATIDDLTARVATYRASLNAELLQIYTDDQGDRTGSYESIDWTVVGPRDIARRKRVDEIVAAGGAKVGADYFHAAMVYQHGETVDEIRRANQLARKAIELDPGHATARWLVAASEDRVLVREGKPQRWGTQYGKKDGVWVLEPVDPATTDVERAEWGVPPLADALARAAAMNAPAPQLQPKPTP